MAAFHAKQQGNLSTMVLPMFRSGTAHLPSLAHFTLLLLTAYQGTSHALGINGDSFHTLQVMVS